MTTRNLPLYYKKSDGTYAQMQYTDTDSFSTLNSIYPVGSVYITYKDTSPVSLFGGTWVEVPDSYYIMACGTKYTRGIDGKGGSNTIAAHSHGLDTGYAKFSLSWGDSNTNYWIDYKYKTVPEWAVNYRGILWRNGSDNTTRNKSDAMELGGTTDSGGGIRICPRTSQSEFGTEQPNFGGGF